MRRTIIVSSTLIFIVLIDCVCIYFMWYRDQQIRFYDMFPASFEYEFHEGDSIQIGRISSGEEKYTNIKKWFRSRSSGWKNDIKTYKPRRVLVSDNIKINVLDDGVIVNYMKNNKWSQVSSNGTTIELIVILENKVR